MSAHFAGSTSVYDRRRRRLAQESPSAALAAGGTKPLRSSRSAPSEPSDDESGSSNVTARRWSVIPRDWRLLALICLLDVCFWGAALWLTQSGWAEQRGLQELTSLKEGVVLHYFSLLQLLAASQLCFLIYWYRSRSRKDFMGRYRIWSWAGLFWGLSCLCLATGVNFDFMQAFLERLHLNAWRPAVVAWLLPFSVGVVAMYRVLRRDMRPSRPSIVAWELIFVIGVLAVMFQLGLETLLPQPARFPAQVALWSAWQTGITICFLIHARYVIHISREAAPRQSSRGTRLLRWSHRRLTSVGERVLTARLPRRRIDGPETHRPKMHLSRRPLRGDQEEGTAPKSITKKPRSTETVAETRSPRSSEAAGVDVVVPPVKGKWSPLGWMRRGDRTAAALTAAGSDSAATEAGNRSSGESTAVEQRRPPMTSKRAQESSPPDELKLTEKKKFGGLFGWGRKKPAEGESAPAQPVVESKKVEKPVPAVSKPVKEAAPAAKADSEPSAKSGGLFGWGRKKPAEGESAPAQPVVESKKVEKPVPAVSKPVKEAAPAAKTDSEPAAKSGGLFGWGRKKSAEGESAPARPVVESKKVEKPVPAVSKPVKEAAPAAKADSEPATKSGGLFGWGRKNGESTVDLAPAKTDSVPVQKVKTPASPPPEKKPEAPVMAPRGSVSTPPSAPPPVSSKPPRREQQKPSSPSSYDEEESYDEEDDDFSGMSSRERKKLKKLRRQQARGED